MHSNFSATGKSPPRFASVEDARAHAKRRLVGAFRIFARLGLVDGTAGHITVRDPEEPTRFWCNPYGMHFSRIRVQDLSLVSHDGRVLAGNPVNAAAFAIHSELHRARPDVHAAAHSHSDFGRVWSTQQRAIEPLFQDACAFFEDVALFPAYAGQVVDPDEGRRLALALGGHKAAIMENHGLLTVGRTVDEAAWWFISLERCCRLQAQVQAIGGARASIDVETARRTRAELGSPYAGWFRFQPLWDWISAVEPDLES